MDRLARSLGTLALLVAVSVPPILLVVAICIGASHVQQIVATSSYHHRRYR